MLEPSAEEKLLTLVTCDYSQKPSMRLVVRGDWHYSLRAIFHGAKDCLGVCCHSHGGNYFPKGSVVLCRLA